MMARHICPKLIILWRCCISFPVENSLCTTCHCLWHKSKLKERTDTKLYIFIKNTVYICIVIFNLCDAVFFILMIDCYIICKKTMSSDIFETNLSLNKFKFIKILGCERKSKSSCTYTEINFIIESDRFIIIYNNLVRHKKTPN